MTFFTQFISSMLCRCLVHLTLLNEMINLSRCGGSFAHSQVSFSKFAFITFIWSLVFVSVNPVLHLILVTDIFLHISEYMLHQDNTFLIFQSHKKCAILLFLKFNHIKKCENLRKITQVGVWLNWRLRWLYIWILITCMLTMSQM